MSEKFEPYFKAYEQVVNMVDTAFDRVKAKYPEKVTCKPGCSDCCFALFDLSFIEALYINRKFNEKLDDSTRSRIIEKANRADRIVYKIKRQAHKEVQAGKNEVDILTQMGLERVRCPFLGRDDHCEMYLYRPITCRLYGVPTAVQGMSHICGKTGFLEGEAYETVHMEKIHQRLLKISTELVASLETRYTGLAEMLVPLSMALLNTYDDEYLGLTGTVEKLKNEGEIQKKES